MAKGKIGERFRKTVRLYRGASGSRVLISPPPEWFLKLKMLEPLYEGGEITCVVQTESSEGYDGYPGCELLFYPGGPNGRLRGSGLIGSVLRGTQRGIDVDEVLYPETPEGCAQGFMDKKAFGIYTNYGDLKNLRDALTKALHNSRRGKVAADKKEEAQRLAVRNTPPSPP